MISLSVNVTHYSEDNSFDAIGFEHLEKRADLKRAGLNKVSTFKVGTVYILVPISAVRQDLSIFEISK